MPGFYVKAIEGDLPVLGRSEFRLVNESSGSSVATIMIGRNGSGKSTILREIALIFRALAGLGGQRRSATKTSWSVIKNIRFGSKLEESLDEDGLRILRKEIREGEIASVGLPSKLIALSFTPFDKFPHPQTRRSYDGTRTEEPFYVYLGFKSDGGLMSARGRLFKTLDDLVFNQLTETRDDRVCRTMSAIGYQSRIGITYRLTPKVHDYLRRIRSGVDYRSFGTGQRLNPRSLQMIDSILSSDVASILLDQREIRVDVDFEYGSSRSISSLATDFIRECVNSRILTIGSVELKKEESDDAIDLLELSSGELNLLTGFLGLAVHLEDNSLVLIDEPENSLHPEWQIRYTEMLHSVLERYSGCHYIIATHSPLVVSGASAIGAFVLRLDQIPIVVEASNFASESPDSTLINAFDVVTMGNNYLRQIVLEGLTLIEQGAAQSARAYEISQLLSAVRLQIPQADPIGEIVDAFLVRVGE